jgi:hypothetical protein
MKNTVKNPDKETDHFQTVLVKNTGFNMCGNKNNICNSLKTDFNDFDRYLYL